MTAWSQATTGPTMSATDAAERKLAADAYVATRMGGLDRVWYI